jgi:hypothetical protein
VKRASLSAVAVAVVALSAAPAQAKVDAFGGIHGHDRVVLTRMFKAHYRGAYVVRGFHASVLYRFRFAGLYWLKRSHGINVDSGAAIFKRHGRSWRWVAHPTRKLHRNLDPAQWTYSASLSGSGEFTKKEVSGADDPSSTTTNSSDIHLTRGGTVRPLDIVRGQGQPGPDTPPSLMGGSGSSRYTDAGDPSHDYSCTLTVGPSSQLQTDIAPDWKQGKLFVDVDFGDPVVHSSIPDCGADLEDPQGESHLFFSTAPASEPVGKPFSVPLVVDHEKHEGDASGSLDETLTLNGAIAFQLLDVKVPTLN